MNEANHTNFWVTEIHKKTTATSFKIKKTIFTGKSKFQQVDVIKTEDHGLMLLNDGIIMLCERDEFAYHEMIAHVPLFVHPNPQNVLIIGGGDGGTSREVLRHNTIKRVVMVEIDRMVIDACKKHMPSLSCALQDPRLDLIIDDGVRYVADTDETFDLVIVDSTDPIGPAEPLFNETFYKNTSKILSPGGILITQAESPFYDLDIQKVMLKNQRPFFEKLHMYLFSNLTYPGGLWSFGFASNKLCPIKNFDPERVKNSPISFKYYNHKIHSAAFSLPTFITDNLENILDSPD